jgi:ABC-type glycerol-3-phosphate transport system permease component
MKIIHEKKDDLFLNVFGKTILSIVGIYITLVILMPLIITIGNQFTDRNDLRNNPKHYFICDSANKHGDPYYCGFLEMTAKFGGLILLFLLLIPIALFNDFLLLSIFLVVIIIIAFFNYYQEKRKLNQDPMNLDEPDY